MKSKKEILAALAHSEDDRLLLANLIDKATACDTRGYLTHTRFLTPAERVLATDAVRLLGLTHRAVFWGGYEDAERTICVFFPDYMDAEAAIQAAPLMLLRAHKRPADTLTHRDYLGSLMGLQIDRAVLGDILVHENGADLFVLEEMADFVQLNFAQAGRKQISVTREPLGTEKQAAAAEREGHGSVASPRLDSVCALVFGLGRAEAQARIEKGLVFLNNVPCLKPEKQVTEGDRLTVRGAGRARIDELGGLSRKGRLFVRYTAFV